jgi:3-methyl-2-oxobutanoate hydroxymethyltransferase
MDAVPEEQGGYTSRRKAERRVTVPEFRARKARGEKIVMVTAYDYPSALLADRAGVDCLLVGDSVASVIQGHSTTLPVTLDEMIYHVRMVRRGVQRALLIADLPFGSYQVNADEAMRSAVRMMKESDADGIKVEGGTSMVPTVKRLTEAGIPVMAHLGLTPQSVHLFGGHKVQGREAEAADRMVADAQALEAAGAFGLVLETIPATLGARITAAITMPTIGIGAGPDCDGQVQVWHDLLGLFPGKTFRHAKRYAELGALAEAALRAYTDEVRRGVFPTKEQSL